MRLGQMKLVKLEYLLDYWLKTLRNMPISTVYIIFHIYVDDVLESFLLQKFWWQVTESV